MAEQALRRTLCQNKEPKAEVKQGLAAESHTTGHQAFETWAVLQEFDSLAELKLADLREEPFEDDVEPGDADCPFPGANSPSNDVESPRNSISPPAHGGLHSSGDAELSPDVMSRRSSGDDVAERSSDGAPESPARFSIAPPLSARLSMESARSSYSFASARSSRASNMSILSVASVATVAARASIASKGRNRLNVPGQTSISRPSLVGEVLNTISVARRQSADRRASEVTDISLPVLTESRRESMSSSFGDDNSEDGSQSIGGRWSPGGCQSPGQRSNVASSAAKSSPSTTGVLSAFRRLSTGEASRSKGVFRMKPTRELRRKSTGKSPSDRRLSRTDELVQQLAGESGPPPDDSIHELLALSKAADEEMKSLSCADGLRQTQQETWKEVFKKLQQDGELHVDDLHTALQLCGLQAPKREWIAEILAEFTSYSTVEMQEFLSICSRYLEKQHVAYLEAFRAKGDGHPVMDSEVHGVLKSIGMDVMEHVLATVLEEVGVPRGGAVEEEQFTMVADLMVEREGFELAECEEFMNVFNFFDLDDSGEMEIGEFAAALVCLGYFWDKAKVAELVKEVDVDCTGELNEREFLMCMRLIRDREVQAMQKAMDGNTDPAVALIRLGFHLPNEDALEECCEQAGIDVDESEMLTASQLWRLVRAYRLCNGFSAAALADFRTIFDAQDDEGAGELCPSRLSEMIRNLGMPFSFEESRAMLEKATPVVDGESFLQAKLTFPRFLKVLQLLRESELARYQEKFKEAFHANEMLLLANRMKLHGVFEELGFDVDQADEQVEKELTDIRTFTEIASGIQTRLSIVSRGFHGFSEEQYAEISESFRKRNIENRGSISNKDVLTAIEEIWPELGHRPTFRDQLQQAIELKESRESDEEASPHRGRFQFDSFLRLLQTFRAADDDERVQKEILARRETGFAVEEVVHFREVFVAGSPNKVDLTFEDLVKMLRHHVPMGEKNAASVKQAFWQVLSKHRPQSKQNPEIAALDFPEYLWFMQTVRSMKFSGVDDEAVKGIGNATEGFCAGTRKAISTMKKTVARLSLRKPSTATVKA
jgi:Ca2+-binding EF-hand superfamily protein